MDKDSSLCIVNFFTFFKIFCKLNLVWFSVWLPLHIIFLLFSWKSLQDKWKLISFPKWVLLKLFKMIFFSPKYFIGQQSGCLIPTSRQGPAWKVSTNSSWRPEIVFKVCSTMRTLFNSFQRNWYFVGKNYWSKTNNRQGRFEGKA